MEQADAERPQEEIAQPQNDAVLNNVPNPAREKKGANESDGAVNKPLKRNQTFQPDRLPFRKTAKLQLNDRWTRGPFAFLNPTRARFERQSLGNIKDQRKVEESEDKEEGSPPSHKDEEEQPAMDVSYKWTSRNNRKGRHALIVTPVEPGEQGEYLTPPSTSSPREVIRGIVRMFTFFPVWDVSWLVATIFTLGSVVWVINASFVFLPLVQPSSEFPNEELVGGGVTAFIGATIFEIGSFFLMAEAVNENRTGCFGWALESVIDDKLRENGFRYRLRPSESDCGHHHGNQKNLVGKPGEHYSPDEDDDEPKSWTWFPTWQELKSHYFRELGFLACLIQLFAASVFWISGFTALPGILNKLSPAAENGAYWTPQIIGGSGFIISGTLFMLETQPKWYIPAPRTLGWHIGLWNTIGGLGFTLCPAFGYDTASWAQYQACLSTYWGSWAFLIGSTIQWYESLAKHPVEVLKVKEQEPSDLGAVAQQNGVH